MLRQEITFTQVSYNESRCRSDGISSSDDSSLSANPFDRRLRAAAVENSFPRNKERLMTCPLTAFVWNFGLAMLAAAAGHTIGSS